MLPEIDQVMVHPTGYRTPHTMIITGHNPWSTHHLQRDMRDDGTRWSRRDRKRDKRERSKRMRGNRSVFEIAKSVHKAARKARQEREKRQQDD